MPSGINTLRVWRKLNTGSIPEETLSANSEIVPVGATKVRSALRTPCRAIARAHPGPGRHRLAGEIALAIEERERALFRGQRRRGEIGLALDRAEPFLGRCDRRCRTVAQPAQDQRVGEAGNPEPDAALAALLLLLRSGTARYR